jgi:hypothetical protein
VGISFRLRFNSFFTGGGEGLIMTPCLGHPNAGVAIDALYKRRLKVLSQLDSGTELLG